jgi:hypothetical protein
MASWNVPDALSSAAMFLSGYDPTLAMHCYERVAQLVGGFEYVNSGHRLSIAECLWLTAERNGHKPDEMAIAREAFLVQGGTYFTAAHLFFAWTGDFRLALESLQSSGIAPRAVQFYTGLYEFQLGSTSKAKEMLGAHLATASRIDAPIDILEAEVTMAEMDGAAAARRVLSSWDAELKRLGYREDDPNYSLRFVARLHWAAGDRSLAISILRTMLRGRLSLAYRRPYTLLLDRWTRLESH